MFSSKLLRYLLISVAALIILAIIGKKARWFGGEKPTNVAIEKVQKRTIYEIITANGKIQPESEIKIGADVSGEIVELFIKEGEPINKGQVLLKIKPDIYISQRDMYAAAVNTSKANYENALARLQQSEAQFNKSSLSNERNKKLWDQLTISKADWESSIAEFESARADVAAAKQNVKSAEYNVKNAEASLKVAEDKLLKASVYSPINGIVTKLEIEKGERVVGTDLMSGTEMLRVADLKKMEVKVDVNENDIVRVNLGDTAIIEVDAYLDQKFKGVVTEIANSATNSATSSADQVTSFGVKIMLLESSYNHLITSTKLYPFRPGMTANVDIQTKKKINVLSVPIEAVTTRSDSALGKKTKDKSIEKSIKKTDIESAKQNEIVFINIKSLARVKKVKTGIQDNNYIEITEGLKENEEVITAPYSAISRKLKDSMLIKVKEKKDLFGDK